VAVDVGDRIYVRGGYMNDPEWLSGRDGVVGQVHAWITGQNGSPDCVVLLDEPLTATGDVRGLPELGTGSFLVLTLRHVGQVWENSGTVHVHLHSDEPPNAAWPDRPRGAWLESHAGYVRI
jgi:hypothetical protein